MNNQDIHLYEHNELGKSYSDFLIKENNFIVRGSGILDSKIIEERFKPIGELSQLLDSIKWNSSA